MKLQVVNVQRFSVHDGPGIRTTIFTRGCSIRCPWCANPETWAKDEFVKKHWDIKEYDVRELAQYCLRDKKYYEEDGGVTVSGGESLLQADALRDFFEIMHKNDINCCVETSLYIPLDNLKKVLSCIDYLYVDIKILKEKKACEVYGGTLTQYLENVEYLKNNFDSKKLIFRLPLIAGVTDFDENLKECLILLNKFESRNLEIFSVHNLGKSKYEKLCIPFNEYEVLSETRLESIKQFFQQNGIRVKINN